VGEGAADGFDAVVAGLDPAMVVVTVTVGEERDGCLVGFHTQASIHPRRYVVWLSVANRTYRLAQLADHLAVHALAASDHALAEHFGGTTGDEEDKLADVAWSPGPGGVPLLEDLPARFVGRVVEWLRPSEGDHQAVVLEPVEATGGELGPDGPFRLGHAGDITPGHPA
jgi:flavin reductase (DIM6/NTAB) family NADH-FMN oxidoreductase RutF